MTQLNAKVSQTGVKLEWSNRSLRIDSEGRWCSYRHGERLYRRCVDAEVVEFGTGVNTCGERQAKALLASIHRYLHRLRPVAWEPTNSHLSATAHRQLLALLDRCIQRSWNDYENQRNRFNQVYKEKVPILPPDRYRDLVVLPAVGCPNRRCSFCAFYQDRPFRAFSADEFDQHLSGVKTLFGTALDGRNGIFLGSANAMALSQRRLSQAMKRIEQVFGIPKRGVASFYDPYFSPQRTLGQWQALAHSGLVRLVIGLETGLPPLRRQLGKKEQLQPLVEAALLVKQAGIQLGVTVLVGAGGDPFATEHVRQTVEVLRSLVLDRKDLIYLSPLELAHDSPSPDLIDQQLGAFHQQLSQISQAKVMTYQMDRYRYYS